jgi:hypothetical protein
MSESALAGVVLPVGTFLYKLIRRSYMRCRFAMCLRTLVWLTTACVFTLPGCGGGGGGESGGQGSVVPFQRETIVDAGRYFYSPRPGDIFYYSETMSMSGLGMSRMIESEERKTYTQVEEIPAVYGCKDTLAGPFVLCVTTGDDETVRQTYSTMDGITIISDGLETFTNAFFMSGSGDDLEPDVIILGRTYRAVLEEVIFSSETGDIVGTETMEMSQPYDNEATMTVPAGTFEPLQCTVECSISTTKYGRPRTAS